MSWFSKLKKGLSKTAAFFAPSKINAGDLEQLEEALLQADVGYQTTSDILDKLRTSKPKDETDIRTRIHQILCEKIEPISLPLQIDSTHKPFVVLMIGVNGAGKTTTIGKMGQFYHEKGYQVSFVAADTFRAGATEQLERWATKTGCPIYTSQQGADAAGLVFDSLQKSRAAGDDLLFIDTAGRLQNRSDLMDELKKITRVIKKQDPSAPHATLLVLDATVGQNALSQVKIFQEMAGVTGLIMTKLDGTAKGGILLALADRFKLPVHALGVGEQADDLRPFTADDYVSSLLGEDS